METKKPYIRCKLAASLDGKTAMKNGESQWITGPEARRVVHAMRARHDAVMVGGGTARDQFLAPEAFDTWEAGWRARLAREAAPLDVLTAANPAFIPRNHRIEQMIQAAVKGDFAPFNRLLEVLAQPFDDQPDAQDLKRPPEPSEVVQQTFCGT